MEEIAKTLFLKIINSLDEYEWTDKKFIMNTVADLLHENANTEGWEYVKHIIENPDLC